MPKSSNRILIEFDRNIYFDANLKLPSLRWKCRVDNGIHFVDENDVLYRLRYGTAKTRHKQTDTTYIHETNSQTGLVHQYRSLHPCTLYREGKWLSSSIQFIYFHKTVDGNNEYETLEKSNWKTDYEIYGMW